MESPATLDQVLAAAVEISQNHPEISRKQALDVSMKIASLSNELLAQGWTKEQIIAYAMNED